MTFEPHQLTVAIVSFNSAATILRALQALSDQTTRGFRILVVDSSTDATPQLIQSHFPEVKVHHLEQRHYPGAARNVAVKLSDTPLIAFVDADCLAAPDWVERILAAHDQPHLIVGGSVGVANPGYFPGLGSFFVEFTPWLRCGEQRALADIPTCCYSFKREAFDQFGPFPSEGYCSDTAFNWKAKQAGHTPWFDPAIHVRHINPESPGRSLKKQIMHGRTYAALRAKLGLFSAGHRALRVLTVPALPCYFWLRTASAVAGVPELRWRFVIATPFVFLFFAAWAMGEAQGYAFDRSEQ